MSSDLEVNIFTNKTFSANFHHLSAAAQELPVSQSIPHLLSAWQQHQVLILVGATGSGKTTQFPKALVLQQAKQNPDDGRRIAVTQPRRLAADLVARRIADELDVTLGSTVGLRYRNCDIRSHDTRLEILTDGMLLAQAKSSLELSEYGTIVIDEAHEHTIATDLLLGLMKDLLQSRDDLKLVIMSATIDAAKFQSYFPGSFLATVEGRAYPVKISYLERILDDEIQGIVEAVLQVHMLGRAGDILVFASGQQEIFSIIAGVTFALRGDAKLRPFPRLAAEDAGLLDCYPLHAQLSDDEQQRAVKALPPPRQHGRPGRKLIVSTNIAETSITLDGVTHIIDSCRQKCKVWNPREESWSLIELWVSKAAAEQRAGRVGRTREGDVWRMCTQVDYQRHMAEHSAPAILQCDMTTECLHLLQLGKSPVNFSYMNAPATETIMTALDLLRELDAVKDNGDLTPRGTAMAMLPLDMCSALALLRSSFFGCSDEILTVVSMVNASEGGHTLWMRAKTDAEKSKLAQIRKRFQHTTGDHLTLFNVYMAWRAAWFRHEQVKFANDNMLVISVLQAADRLRLQLLTVLFKIKDWRLNTLDRDNRSYWTRMLQALAAGNFVRVAKREPIQDDSQSKPRYELVRQRLSVDLARSVKLGGDPMGANNEWVIYHELDRQADKLQLRLVTAIPVDILVTSAAAFWSDLQFMPSGHVKDSLMDVLVRLTGRPAAYHQGGMPNPSTGS